MICSTFEWVFLGVAETVVGSLLFCDVHGYCYMAFQFFVLHHFGDHTHLQHCNIFTVKIKVRTQLSCKD